jgi:hypothetical protein
VLDSAELERFGDRERPVPELRLGSEELDGHVVLRQRPQRERGLERRDPSTRDEYVHAVAIHPGLLTGPLIRRSSSR